MQCLRSQLTPLPSPTRHFIQADRLQISLPELQKRLNELYDAKTAEFKRLPRAVSDPSAAVEAACDLFEDLGKILSCLAKTDYRELVCKSAFALASKCRRSFSAVPFS